MTKRCNKPQPVAQQLGSHPALPEYGRRDACPTYTISLMTLPFDERQPFVAAEVRVGQLVLVEAELVQDRGVDVAEVVAASRRPAGRWRRSRRRPGRP